MGNDSLRKRDFALFGLILIIIISVSCAAKALRPGAERIIVSNTPPPQGCKFMGTIVGNQGGAFSGPWTSNKNLAQGAINDMRNKAFDMGANYLQLLAHTTGVTASGNIYDGSGSSSAHQTDVTQTGSAYSCPPDLIGLQ
jgi:hypothetical protein